MKELAQSFFSKSGFSKGRIINTVTQSESANLNLFSPLLEVEKYQNEFSN